jgi:hypothetical protein
MGREGGEQLYSSTSFAVTSFYIFLPPCPVPSICISFRRKLITVVPCSSSGAAAL